MAKRKYLGEILVKNKVLTKKQVKDLLEMQQSNGIRLGELAIQDNKAIDRDITQALAEQFEMEYVEISNIDIDTDILDLIPYEVAREHHIVPVEFREYEDGEGLELVVAMRDPLDLYTLDNVRFMVAMPVHAVLATANDISMCMQLNYCGNANRKLVERDERTKIDRNCFRRDELVNFRNRAMIIAECSITNVYWKEAYLKLASACDALDAMTAREEGYDQVVEKPKKKKKVKKK